VADSLFQTLFFRHALSMLIYIRRKMTDLDSSCCMIINFSMGSCPVLDFYSDQLKPTLLKIPAQHFFTLNGQYELAWKALAHSTLVKFRTLYQSTESGLQIVHQPCPSPFADFTGVGGNWTVTNKPQILTDGATIDYWYALPCQPSVKSNQRHQIEAWAFLLPPG